MKTVLPYSDLPTDGGNNFHVEIAHSKLSPAVPGVTGQAAADGASGKESFAPNANYSNNPHTPPGTDRGAPSVGFQRKHGLG
jgi:hypothetical protein